MCLTRGVCRVGCGRPSASQEVLTMLRERPSARVLMHRQHKHADFVMDLRWQDKMVQEVGWGWSSGATCKSAHLACRARWLS
jgi:hypothetical protein